MRLAPLTAAAAIFAALLAGTAVAQSPAAPACAKCHASKHETIAATPHGAMNDAGGSMCQSCHGDAAAHLRDPRSKPANVVAKGKGAGERNAVCLTCHSGSKHLEGWASAKHTKSEVACATCHVIHKEGESGAALATARPTNEGQLCGTCHAQVRSATHPPNLSAKCSDCHNPHGTPSPGALKAETPAARDAICLACHSGSKHLEVWASGKHAKSEVSCATCHGMHKPMDKQRPNEAEVCGSCHKPVIDATLESTHHPVIEGNMKCSSCHNPHGTRAPSMLKVGGGTERDAACLTCHGGNRHLAFWESGKHARSEVSCTNCHSIHNLKGQPQHATRFSTTSRPIEADTCGKCHQQVRNAALKPSHHPILEGKVQCSACHNPHGALSPVMLKHESVNKQCLSCHAEKRGPFVFGHPPVEENCLACHTPHGSSHGKLLAQKVPNLCQDCHVTGGHPTSFYGANQAWTLPGGAQNTSPSKFFIARGCMNCHTAIHGSNGASYQGKFLIR